KTAARRSVARRCFFLGSTESHRSELNRRPLDYESSALPLSYCGEDVLCCNTACPGADSNRDALRHHPLKMACLPISPPGQLIPHISHLRPTSNVPRLRERRGSNPRPLE